MTFHYFTLFFILFTSFLIGIGGFQGIKLISIPNYSTYSNNKASSTSSSTSLSANPRKIDVGSENGFQSNAHYRHDLLNSNDEFALSRQFKLGVNIQAQHQALTEELGREATYDELSNFLLIPYPQIKALIERGEIAKKRLVSANMRLVLHIAKYYRYRGITYPDLVQEGTFGLVKAVEKYDPERGFRFSTYASWWIKQAISRSVAEKSRIVRLPVHIHDLMVSLSRVEKSFQIANGRKPTTNELAQRLGLPIQKVELLMKSKREVNSIDEDAFTGSSKNGGGGSGNEIQVKDRIASDHVDPSERNENLYIRAELRRSMASLSEREAQILEMRFGLIDGNSRTLEEIGKIFNVTRERVRQIEARALSKLRQPRTTSELKEIFQDQSLIVPAPMDIDASSVMTQTVSSQQQVVDTPSYF